MRSGCRTGIRHYAVVIKNWIQGSYYTTSVQVMCGIHGGIIISNQTGKLQRFWYIYQ